MMKSIVVVLIILFSHGCTMFDKNERLLAAHQKSDGTKIKVYYIELGTTTSDVIQVRTSKQSQPLWVSEKYNYLKKSQLINDTSFRLILSDTGYNNFNNRYDTITISIK